MLCQRVNEPKAHTRAEGRQHTAAVSSSGSEPVHHGAATVQGHAFDTSKSFVVSGNKRSYYMYQKPDSSLISGGNPK